MYKYLGNVLTIAIQNAIIDMKKGGRKMAIKSANVMARVEPDIKTKAEGIMASLGVPASVVINALYHQIIYTNGLPFSLTLPPSVPTIEDMSKEDFDTEMKESLKRMKKGEGKNIDEVFDEIRTKNK